MVLTQILNILNSFLLFLSVIVNKRKNEINPIKCRKYTLLFINRFMSQLSSVDKNPNSKPIYSPVIAVLESNI